MSASSRVLRVWWLLECKNGFRLFSRTKPSVFVGVGKVPTEIFSILHFARTWFLNLIPLGSHKMRHSIFLSWEYLRRCACLGLILYWHFLRHVDLIPRRWFKIIFSPLPRWLKINFCLFGFNFSPFIGDLRLVFTSSKSILHPSVLTSNILLPFETVFSPFGENLFLPSEGT
jgi:hypothetical protein